MRKKTRSINSLTLLVSKVIVSVSHDQVADCVWKVTRIAVDFHVLTGNCITVAAPTR